jgi:nucleoside-diphosphate-sugar epimerase
VSVIGKHDGILVAGGGGFIGGHLVAALVADGHRRVRAVDVKPLDEWYQRVDGVENLVLDLKDYDACVTATNGMAYVFNLAADMGGMGFIETHKAACMLSVLINTHLLMAARDAGVRRFFFSSSACVYAADKQTSPDVTALKESDAYPAEPEDGYGWEKLFSERMCRHFTEDFGLETRVARYHNVYGPYGTWTGGREKAPAACIRKVLECRESGTTRIEVWGDGQQTRSFMYIDDCVDGTRRLMESALRAPVNIGSDQLVTIDQLYRIAEGLAGVTLQHVYDPSKPKGVRGRNSDNEMITRELGWAPSIRLEAGMRKTFEWIEAEMRRARLESPAQRAAVTR